MGMLDYFEPEPDLRCPRCGRVLIGWQGKEAENALFVWKQGVRHPTTQWVDEDCRLSEEELTRFTLPEEFTMVTDCTCSTKFLLDAVGTSIDGLWSQSRLMEPHEIEKMYKNWPRGRRKALRQWLLDRV